jgi:hypothetical protein
MLNLMTRWLRALQAIVQAEQKVVIALKRS